MPIRIQKAFTLMELMVVVVVVGLMAAFAVPGYDKAVDKALHRDAERNVRLLAGAQIVYKARYGKYFDEALVATYINDLNSALGLNITEQKGVTYWCLDGSFVPAEWACVAQLPGKWWIFQGIPGSILKCTDLAAMGLPQDCPNQ